MLDWAWVIYELPNGIKLPFAVIVFVLVWIAISFRHVPFMPLGRSGGTVFGACILVLIGCTSATSALSLVNTDVILLLTGFMVIVEFFERAGIFTLIGDLSAKMFKSAFGTLIWICTTTGVLAALVCGDVCMLVVG